MEEYDNNFTQIEQKIETLKSKSVSDFVELYNHCLLYTSDAADEHRDV